MARIAFQGEAHECDGASVLDCLLSHGHAIPHSCRTGVCQTCLMRARSGVIPERAQHGLTPGMKARGLFLACQCMPGADLDLVPANDAIELTTARVRSVDSLGADIFRVRLEPLAPYPYRAGQFARVYRDAATARNYSLASVPVLDDLLELHVSRVPGGQVSTWICDTRRVDTTLTVSEASGSCFHTPDKPDQDLLLIGGGTGLAPLVGIARDALYQGHRGRIRLYHGARTAAGLYLADILAGLAAAYPHFAFRQCADSGPGAEGVIAGSPLAAALREHPDLSNWRVYLCGSPGLVEAARMETFLAGAASCQILADPFLPSAG